MINIFPEFESRQVLTSDELNWMACYLDTQNRQSRRFLAGCGLIGGLQVRLLNNSVQVTNGIGVTSAGHIVTQFSNEAGFTTYTKAKPYTQKANEKLAYHYLPDLDPTAENYTKSVDVPSLYFPGLKGEILELFEDTFNDAPLIDGGALTGKVALLFAEILQKELKDCEGDNCQERGKKYIFTTKVLVISKEDALLLLNAEYNIQTQSEDAISKLAFPWLHLPNINILKPVFSNNSVNTAFEEKTIVHEYIRCIRDFIDTIGNNQLLVEQSLANLKNYCSVINGHVTIIGQLIAKVKSTGVLNNNNQSPALSGIVYDYLWCFVKAYQELQAEAQLLKAKCFTHETAFPNHILLGVITNQNTEFEAPVAGGYSVYRHTFQSRLVQTQQADVCKNIIVYLNRLVAMVSGFDDTVLSNKKDIRITAGGHLYDPLSLQAIPYYLKQTTMAVWNSRAGQLNLNKYNTVYGSVQENQVPSAKLPYNTLPSSMQGNHAFFRIEGVYGQPAVSALNTVFQLRKKHGLAFEVLLLRINEKAPFSHSFNFTINEDIESMYQVVRAEVLKQISLNVKYLAGLQFKTGKFAGIQNELIKELEKSYLFFLNNLNISILAAPLEMVLTDAIMASNITSNYKAKAYTAEAKYSELETIASNNKAVASSYMKKENAGITSMKFNAAAVGLIKPGFGFSIGVLFFNSLGNLVNTIKTSNKFKDTSDISFYTHLLSVVKAMQKNEKEKLLFLYALRVYCSLKLQEEYLAENFLELDVTKYRDNLEDELLPASDALVDYLRTIATNTITNDEILYQVTRDEMLEYAGRIQFDDDWIKIIQLDAENKKRNGGLGVENLLEKFVKLHPGVAHGCGVPKGGTYLMVYDANNQVVADFYLPYIISSHLRPIQYTLIENKTLTLSGTIRDHTGKPIETSLLVGNATVVSNKEGFYNALVTENSTVKIICKVAGYAEFTKEVPVADKPLTVDIELVPVQAKTFTTTVRFINQTGKPIERDITVMNVTKKEEVIAKKGALPVTDEPKKAYDLEVTDSSFEKKRFTITIGEKDQEEKVSLTEIDVIRIQLVGDPTYVPALFNDIKVVDPAMEVDTSRLKEGLFVTKEKMDITKSATVQVVYNKKPVTQEIKPGEEVNKVFVEGTANDKERKVGTVVSIVYPDTGGIDKIKSVLINDTTIAINLETDIGEGIITSDGQFDLSREFKNVKPVGISNFSTVKAAILVIDAQLLKERDKITAKSFLTTTQALTAAQLRSLTAKRKEFAAIGKATELRIENFYCLLLPAADIAVVSKILKL
jgi:hypothetical protein